MNPELNDTDYRRLAALVYAKSGIFLHDGKRNLVRSRLVKRLRALGVEDYESYYNYLKAKDDGTELVKMLDAITTNQTAFFREQHHFDFMEKTLFPKMESSSEDKIRIRIWSAGCSTGEEPYSIAISILEFFLKDERLDAKILATDISAKVLEQARQGVYSADRLREMPVTTQRRYFQKGFGKQEGFFKIKERVRQMVVFRNHSLMNRINFGRGLDAIFCRNVMIYFDKRTQNNLVRIFYEYLKPGGYLFVGHSESLAGVDHAFEYVKPSIYLKS
ncbi:MAG: protein-glutamate O-methyltransferase [Desulfatibacillaceae bacterium]|nr:protein-glutamate O-methyltransferase [Desulfatibacillaceae bacterium]